MGEYREWVTGCVITVQNLPQITPRCRFIYASKVLNAPFVWSIASAASFLFQLNCKCCSCQIAERQRRHYHFDIPRRNRATSAHSSSHTVWEWEASEIWPLTSGVCAYTYSEARKLSLGRVRSVFSHSQFANCTQHALPLFDKYIQTDCSLSQCSGRKAFFFA